ncbi:hypothetical protein GDO86_015235 [Hymenochirus boettgeri]|uniref:FERM domain-containing protein n=1 Tax=Hymenochirus boettgeri TaxID=247094 RepID=A0A8T2JS44_9PIPI|nr:hypothetical protein GDO86_015235 [Hymenochirus boettgeri]
MDEKTPATTLLVGPRHGISHVIDLKTNLTTVLFEFSQVTKVQLFRESQGVARVETSFTETKSLVLLMEWPEATSFACLIAGYYRLMVDSKTGIFYRAAGHLPPPQIIKAGMVPITLLPSPPFCMDKIPLLTVNKILAAAMEHGCCQETPVPKGSAPAPSTPSEGPEPVTVCYLHLHDQEGRDVNQNIVTEEARPRTKSEPTFKVSSNQPCPERIEDSPEVSRSRSFTMDSQVKVEDSQFFCDSCKAKMKNRLGGGGGGVKCANPCGSANCKDNMVDLISLPPPELQKGEEEEQEEEEGNGGAAEREVANKASLLPTAAPPPPGFEDNSSDEEDPKQKAGMVQEKIKEQEKGNCVLPPAYEELPVTLIDSVQTRTVRDHARELDDALVSTLQALEALAASEDFPNPAPQPTTGLIVLAAITPDSSLDSGHETNSSELTDVSEIVTAMKQHHNTAYILAHSLNKESLLSRKDLPFRIQTCTAQAVLTSPCTLGCQETSPLLKSSILQQSITATAVSKQEPTARAPSPINNLNHQTSRLPSPIKSNEDSICPALKQTPNSLQITGKRSPRSNHVSTEEEEAGSGGHDVLHLSPTDDERLHAKACSARHLEEQSQSLNASGKKEMDKTSKAPAVSPNQTEKKEAFEKSTKVEQKSPVPGSNLPGVESAKITAKPESDTNTLLIGPDKVFAPIDLDDCDAPAKPKARAPFRLRKLFSATFPTRMRRETDERQAQLLKVKQYEMEFLEELLKPQGKVGSQRKEIPCTLVPSRCSCQVRSSPLEKVPGMSREQRRSCDCKRIIRGIRMPPNPPSDHENRKRPRLRDTDPPRLRLVRSSSLESHSTEKMTSCLNTCATSGDYNIRYKKLAPKYGTSELEKNEVLPSILSKNQKKDNEPILKNKAQDIPEVREEKKKIPVATPRQEEMFSVQTKVPEEEGSASGEKCCSIRHCFNCRRCSSTEDSSEKDELSYSIPMQILPGMSLNAETTPVVSQTLQVLDATICSVPEEGQTQEIDLRTATFEGSLAKVNALRGRSYSLPDGFVSVQLDTSELLTVLRQCLVNPEAEEPKPDAVNISQRKQELTMRFKEFRASCRRVAGVDKSPEHMLTAVTSSFQVLCGLIETFVKLVFVVRSESQRQELLGKVEEVVRNYTFLLRAAEESSARTVGQSQNVVGQLAKQSATVATAVSTFSRSIKTLMSK